MKKWLIGLAVVGLLFIWHCYANVYVYKNARHNMESLMIIPFTGEVLGDGRRPFARAKAYVMLRDGRHLTGHVTVEGCLTDRPQFRFITSKQMRKVVHTHGWGPTTARVCRMAGLE